MIEIAYIYKTLKKNASFIKKMPRFYTSKMLYETLKILNSYMMPQQAKIYIQNGQNTKFIHETPKMPKFIIET